MTTTERQTYALGHPIDNPDPTAVAWHAYQRIEQQPDGNLLVTQLAVDR